MGKIRVRALLAYRMLELIATLIEQLIDALDECAYDTISRSYKNKSGNLRIV